MSKKIGPELQREPLNEAELAPQRDVPFSWLVSLEGHFMPE
jgi:hypothetical protein